MNEWELVTNEEQGHCGEITQRLKVPGGWLYRTARWNDARGKSPIAMVFVSENYEALT